jgi:hypothetical protein
MGMFDNLKVKVPLPLNNDLSSLKVDWTEEIFQTKDLENAMELYEITPEGKLKYLKQEREWEKDETSFLGGYLAVKSEEWVEIPYHGVILFYTSGCDKPDLNPDLLFDSESMSWEEVVTTEGYDYWIEFIATFDVGNLKGITLEKVEKTPIRVRLASNKEWGEKRRIEESKLFNKVIRKLRKIELYRDATRCLSRLEQKGHELLSQAIRKIS